MHFESSEAQSSKSNTRDQFVQRRRTRVRHTTTAHETTGETTAPDISGAPRRPFLKHVSESIESDGDTTQLRERGTTMAARRHPHKNIPERIKRLNIWKGTR